MAPCADPRKLVCTLWLCALPVLAHAQAPEPSATSPAANEGASAPSTTAAGTRSVLFLLPQDDAAAQDALRDTLLAQFALIDANLVFAPEPEGESSLATRIQNARSLAQDSAAIAVFWIDTEADGRWFLHMMDVQDDRVVVRQVDAAGERRAAAIEAIGVMARSSTRALIEGAPETPAPDTGPKATPAPAPAPPSMLDAFRLWLGYTGTTFAADVPWQHGAAIGASWLGPRPFYVGLSLILAPTIEPHVPAAMLPASFSVQRTPIAAQFGYRHLAGRVALDGELGVMVERWYRPPPDDRPMAGTDHQLREASTHWVWELAPRLRCELRIAVILGLYAGGGLDILLNQYTYVSQSKSPGMAEHTLLGPNTFRPVAELGISFYP